MIAHVQAAAYRAFAAAGLALAMSAVAARPVVALQPTPVTAQLAARIDTEEAQLLALRVQLSKEQNNPRPIQVAGLFGESDEEKAARLQQQQHEQAQDSSIATLNQRVGDLEESLRRLTGQMEQLDHRVSEFNDKLTRMQKDFDYKLCSIAAQQLGATNGQNDQNALQCGNQQSGGTAPSEGGAGPAGGTSQRLAAPPGILGTLPQNAVAGSAPQSALGLSPDTHSQFDAAMNLLAKAQYDEARAAFRSFADNFPGDDLAPQAIYWVGDIDYVQKDFAGASRAFAEELKKYPASPRAPESMLKLGQSLLALNQKKEGCLALAALASKYPGASKNITEQAHEFRRSAGCR